MDPKKNSPNKKNGDNKKNKNLKGFLTLVAWALVLTVALNFLSAYAGNRSNKSTSHEVDYSQLWQLVEEDKITDVIFENNTVYATPVEGYVFTDDKGKELDKKGEAYKKIMDRMNKYMEIYKEKGFDAAKEQYDADEKAIKEELAALEARLKA